MRGQRLWEHGGTGCRLLGFLGFSLGVALLSGCGGGGPALVPVEGQVLVGKAPLKGGVLTLLPDTKKGNTAKGSIIASIAADGTFKVMTDGKPGAPVGPYKVTISPPPPDAGGDPGKLEKGGPTKVAAPPGRQVNPKYEDPTTTDLTIDVAATPPAGGYKLTPSR